MESQRVDGKIHSITRTAGSAKPDLEFVYDALGNRIAKKVIPEGGGVEITYYIRDAQGNVMSTYNITSARLTQHEQHIYGSSRLELRITNYELRMGKYESVITDRKNGVGSFQPHVLSHTDYYTFGAPMETGERTWVLVDANVGEEEGYRYGFNAKEVDSEGIGGHGSTYDYGFRIYNPALGKFLSIDPLTDDFPWYTPYQFAGNKPIWAIDLDGKEELMVTHYLNAAGQLYKTIIIVVSAFGMQNNAEGNVTVHTSVVRETGATVPDPNNPGAVLRVFTGNYIGTNVGKLNSADNPFVDQNGTPSPALQIAATGFQGSNAVWQPPQTNQPCCKDPRAPTDDPYKGERSIPQVVGQRTVLGLPLGDSKLPRFLTQFLYISPAGTSVIMYACGVGPVLMTVDNGTAVREGFQAGVYFPYSVAGVQEPSIPLATNAVPNYPVRLLNAGGDVSQAGTVSTSFQGGATGTVVLTVP